MDIGAAGLSGFVWFMGVVENRMDPKKLGRVQVRCLGFHTENKQNIPTEALPWAMPLQPVTSSAMNGMGQTPLGPVEGTHVVGFFLDGLNAQQPVIMGTLGGVPEEVPDKTVGFNDPSGMYPQINYLNEPDTNRLARAENIDDTVVQSKRDSVITKIPLPHECGTWNEPPNPYNASYPFNHVRETESGHIVEFDDTPDNERIHLYHRTGTFEEIHPNGNKVVKVVRDNYEFTLGSKFVHIKGYKKGNKQVQGTGDLIVSIEGDVYEYINGNVERQINGSVREQIHGNYHRHVEGDVVEVYDNNRQIKVLRNDTRTCTNLKEFVDADCETRILGKSTLDAKEQIEFKSGKSFSAVASENAVVQAGKQLHLQSGDVTDIQADTTLKLKAKDAYMGAGNKCEVAAGSQLSLSGNTVKIHAYNDATMESAMADIKLKALSSSIIGTAGTILWN